MGGRFWFKYSKLSWASIAAARQDAAILMPPYWSGCSTVVSQCGEGHPVLGFLSCEFHVLFRKVTLLSFQVNGLSSCVTSLTSPLIRDCFHLCPPSSCVYSLCLPLSSLPEYFVRSCRVPPANFTAQVKNRVPCQVCISMFDFNSSEEEWPYFVIVFLLALKIVLLWIFLFPPFFCSWYFAAQCSSVKFFNLLIFPFHECFFVLCTFHSVLFICKISVDLWVFFPLREWLSVLHFLVFLVCFRWV